MTDEPTQLPKETVYLVIPGVNVVSPGSASLELARSVLSSLPAQDWSWDFKVSKDAATDDSSESYNLVSSTGQRAYFYEVPWTSLYHKNKLTNKTAFAGLVESVQMLGYWLPALPKLGDYSRLACGFLIGSFGILLWWICTLILAYSSISVALTDDTFSQLLGKQWYVIAAFLFLTLFKRRLDFVVNVASFSKLYLSNRRFRLSAEQHLIKAWEQIQTKHPEARIVFVSHSWGTILHLNSLALLRSSSSASEIVHFTMGSPAVVLSARKESLRARWLKDIESSADPWFDVYSENDWLCAKIELGQDARRTEFIEIPYEDKLGGKISGNHDRYYSHEKVTDQLARLVTIADFSNAVSNSPDSPESETGL